MMVFLYLLMEIFDRIRSLEEVCKKAREKDSELKTSISIGELDIELHT